MPLLNQMTEQYARDYEDGLQYQDFITDKMYELGIPIVGYSSMKYQNEKGEGRSGIEIKHDKNIRKYGNLYIEVFHRLKKENDFVPGGVLSDDNSWLFIVGDYEEIFIFSKDQLAKMYASNRYETREKATSIGMLLPVIEAEKFLILKKITL